MTRGHVDATRGRRRSPATSRPDLRHGRRTRSAIMRSRSLPARFRSGDCPRAAPRCKLAHSRPDLCVLLGLRRPMVHRASCNADQSAHPAPRYVAPKHETRSVATRGRGPNSFAASSFIASRSGSHSPTIFFAGARSGWRILIRFISPVPGLIVRSLTTASSPPTRVVSEPTIYVGRRRLGVMGADEQQRLKSLETENATLKKIVAEGGVSAI